MEISGATARCMERRRKNSTGNEDSLLSHATDSYDDDDDVAILSRCARIDSEVFVIDPFYFLEHCTE